MNILTNKEIAIVGGGPGGLTLARLLQMGGRDAAVYERDSSQASRNQGATLDLHYDSGLQALREADLMDAFWANYRPGADQLIVMDGGATIWLDEFVSSEYGPERPEIDRGPLRNLLIDSLKPGTVFWDRQLVSLDRIEGAFQLSFSNRETASADIVVAADGANSRLRPYITPIRPIYSGVTVMEGHVPHAALAAPGIQKLAGEGKICVLGNEKSLFIGAKGDGSLEFYTGHKADEFWSKNCGLDFSSTTEMLRWFQAEFSGWSSLWNDLFEKAEPRFVPRPQYYMPLDQTWDALPGLTMIGDAAHVMPPYAGEGVNMAMLDALELSKCLLSGAFPDTRSAIAAYEAQMRDRAAEVTQTTLEQTRAFHSKEAIAYLVQFFGAHIAEKASRSHTEFFAKKDAIA